MGAMTGMSVQEEAMDSSTSEEEESPFSQASRRRDPVYLASMAAHSLPSSQELERHHLDQLQQQQEQQQHLEQQQLEYQLQLMHLQQQHQQLPLSARELSSCERPPSAGHGDEQPEHESSNGQ